MYSLLCSKLDLAIEKVGKQLKRYIKKESNIIILPWAFPKELDKTKFEEEYFKKGERRYNRYLNAVLQLGAREENFKVINCYDINKEDINNQIDKSDIIILPGGNPEMFYNKVEKELQIKKVLRDYKGLIIGESAGAVLHFHKYFLTEENNFYQYFAYYDGFGLLQDTFEIDVHTKDNEEYITKLKNIAINDKKIIYAIMDDGAILVNRNNNKIEFLHNTKIIKVYNCHCV